MAVQAIQNSTAQLAGQNASRTSTSQAKSSSQSSAQKYQNNLDSLLQNGNVSGASKDFQESLTLLKMQKQMQQESRMWEYLSNMLKTIHETARAIVANFRP